MVQPYVCHGVEAFARRDVPWNIVFRTACMLSLPGIISEGVAQSD